ncbi:MAG: hypothetical protein GY923_15390 [Aestuariibacter sp.]|nr:hypothetical protein [Aestuariibacter sp.]
MKQSLARLFKNITNVLESPESEWMDIHSGRYGHSLERLCCNLKELKDRKSEGESVIDEFFEVYVIDE